MSEKFQENLKEKSNSQGGSIILTWNLKKEDMIHQNELPIAFTAWLGKATLRPLINIDFRKFFLSMIGVDFNEIGIFNLKYFIYFYN